MKMQVIAIKDVKVGAFGAPFFVKTKAQGVRSFQDEVNRAEENNILYKHPEDFELWSLAEWDEDTGTFSNNTPEMILQGINAKRD